jgi:hypothetical protein
LRVDRLRLCILGRPRANARGFRCCPSHPVTDKGIERFAESREDRNELFPNVFFPTCGVKSGRSHGGFPHESNGHDVPMRP